MRARRLLITPILLGSFFILLQATSAAAEDVKQQTVEGPNKVTIKIRMEGPYTADVPLQIVCYFKYSTEGAKRMSGAVLELDKHLGGVIASLRERGEFTGDELETILIIPPQGSIKAKSLLLIGLGEEESLSLNKMERVGRIALREAARLGVTKVAFAPLIRDQGNSKFTAKDLAGEVLRGVFLAYDTEKRLQKEGLAKAYTLNEWWQEAGPMYFEETTMAAKKSAMDAESAIAARPASGYNSTKK